MKDKGRGAPKQHKAAPEYRLTTKQRRYMKVKRVLDFILALLGLVVLAAPLLVIAAIQKVTSPHEPVFFRHRRVGKDGEVFDLMKIRSMRSSAPKYKAAQEFKDSTSYITPFGQFLRSTSIDELPQLFQVLSGKMSLVGPRPLIPQERLVHRLRRRYGVYQIRPGITGWAQVNGRVNISDKDKAALDLEYLKRMSFSMDCRILWLTVRKVLRGEDVLVQDGKKSGK